MTNGNDPLCVALDAVPVCGSVWTREGLCVDCNEAALRFFGLGSKQHYLDQYTELSPACQPSGEDSGVLLLAHIHKAFAEGRAEFPWLHRRLDGHIIPAQLTLTRIGQGDHARVVAYAVERHDTRATEVSERDGDVRAHLMLDNAPLACTFWNARGEIVDCNEEALRQFGLGSKQEFVARYADLLPEYQPDGGSSVDLARQHLMQARQTGRLRLPVPWMRQTAAGEPVPCELTVVRVMQGEEPVMVAFLRDLREEMKLQAEKREAEERIQIMLDASPFGCTLWDEGSRLVDCNAEAVKMFGPTPRSTRPSAMAAIVSSTSRLIEGGSPRQCTGRDGEGWMSA